MKSFKTLKKILKRKGFVRFLISSLIFIAILFLENSLFPSEKVLVSLNVFGRTSVVLTILVCLLFFALERRRLFELKPQKINYKISALFFMLNIASFLGFYLFKTLIIANPLVVDSHLVSLVIFRYAFPAVMAITLLIAVFGLKFLKQFYKSFIFALFFAFVFFQLSLFFQTYWKYFSIITTRGTVFLLGFLFNDIVVNYEHIKGPFVGIGDFKVLIENPCSGIEGLSLFILLFMFIIFKDRDEINIKRSLFALVVGSVGMIVLNTIRIFLLFLVGIYYDPVYAIHSFHTNSGWVLFILYFMVFWFFVYYFIRRDHGKPLMRNVKEKVKKLKK